MDEQPSDPRSDGRGTTRPGLAGGTVRNLSIAIVFLGGLSFCVGAVALVYALVIKCQFNYNDFYSHRNYEDDSYGYYWTTTTTTTTLYTTMCDYEKTFLSPGLWCGIMFITTGVIGIIAAKRRTLSFLITLMSLSAVSNWTASVGVVISIASHFEKRYDQVNSYPVLLHVCNAIISLVCLIGFIIQWIIFSFTCRTVCCDGRKGYPKLRKRQKPFAYHPIPLHSNDQYITPPNQINSALPTMESPGASSLPLAPQNPPTLAATGPDTIYLVQGHRVIGMLPQSLQHNLVGVDKPSEQPLIQT